ncbi:MAG TPA: apolipoprotein N-acyltransferase [Pyrinomonadaceae bacterium]|nr:apolipoprotein N-acyltransferase [Pyrinomonadaceae bacterium]
MTGGGRSVKLGRVQQAISTGAAPPRERFGRLLAARARASAPAPEEAFTAAASGALLVLAFPDFDLWPLAWVGLVPLLFVIARRPQAGRAFVLGWLAGTIFFYGSCHWLTFPMIRYGGIPAPVAYLLLLFPTLAAGLFPALFAAGLAYLCRHRGAGALLLLAPPLWAATEWARLGVIGQLWNALGYSQAFKPILIQPARLGGVYAVSFLLVAVNSAVAYAILKRDVRSLLKSSAVVVGVVLVLFVCERTGPSISDEETPSAVVVAVQPNVIPDFNRSLAEYDALGEQHFEASERALRALDEESRWRGLPRVVVWPESPMNFRFSRDSRFRERVARFVQINRASLLINSLEPAPSQGGYNAAVLINEEGRLAVQYDKIRLMPFGEYVPLPRWIPGAGHVRGIVGEFTPGTRYSLMPLGTGGGAPRAGVFICLESAYPYITRRFAAEGADVLIELTNDAYQGDTGVMRQHLANAVFRAVETARPLLRVTNSGISARVTPRGGVSDATGRFEQAARVWTVAHGDGGRSFYVKYGDAFVAACSLLSLAALVRARRKRAAGP